jgi:transposase
MRMPSLVRAWTAMAETRMKSDQDFKEGAVRLVRETGRPVAQVARTWGSMRARWGTGSTRTGGAVARVLSWVRMSGRSWPGCRENAELAMRCVLKRSVALWVYPISG